MSRWLAGARLALVCVVTGAPAPGAAGTTELAAPYLAARDGGKLGEVSGSAHAEPRSPTGPPLPYDAVTVRLLPYSPGFEAELDGIKATLRDSQRAYLDAAGRVEAARAAYEGALAAAGAGDLVRSEVGSPAGQFRIRAVPAGPWLLLASRSVEHAATGKKVPRREVDRFVGNVERTGHVVVTYWRVKLDVRAGERLEVALTDRNAWMTGVREGRRSREPAGDATRRGRGPAR